jgi:hypothetical protein
MGSRSDRLRSEPARPTAARPDLQAAKDQVAPLAEHVTGHLDSGYDSHVTRRLLDDLGLERTNS